MQRRDFLIGALGLAVAGTAQAQTTPHWLVGTWLGELKTPQDKHGEGRRMVVVSVKGEDVSLRYGVMTTEKPPIVHGTLHGDELRFNSPGVKIGDNSLILTRSGPDELSGTWGAARTGKTYPITFKRQK